MNPMSVLSLIFPKYFSLQFLVVFVVGTFCVSERVNFHFIECLCSLRVSAVSVYLCFVPGTFASTFWRRFVSINYLCPIDCISILYHCCALYVYPYPLFIDFFHDFYTSLPLLILSFLCLKTQCQTAPTNRCVLNFNVWAV